MAVSLGLFGAACEDNGNGGGVDEDVEDIVEQTADEADEIDPQETESPNVGDDVGDETP